MRMVGTQLQEPHEVAVDARRITFQIVIKSYVNLIAVEPVEEATHLLAISRDALVGELLPERTCRAFGRLLGLVRCREILEPLVAGIDMMSVDGKDQDGWIAKPRN